MSHWRALMTPQKAAPWTGCIHFCDSYPIMSTMSFTSVSIFSVWCCSRYLSLWTKRPRQKSVIKESKYLKMTFKLFNFSLSIFVSLSLFSLSWSVSLKAKISEKKHFFSLQSEKKIDLFSLIFALSENERRTLLLSQNFYHLTRSGNESYY